LWLVPSGMEYIDIHAHVNVAAFKDDGNEVINRALEAGVAMIHVGTQFDTSIRAVALVSEYSEGVYATVGLHPIHTGPSFFDSQELDESEKGFTNKGELFDAEKYRDLAVHPRVVAIGECGLDYYRDIRDEDWRKQVEAFEMQIAFANKMGKPLMLHVRNGSRGSAYRDALKILKRDAKVLGNAHFFAGTLEDAKKFWDMGYSTSFTGVLTFTHEYDEIVKQAPCEFLHAETDAPYVAPVPHRGKRNEPLYVREVVQRMAEIRGVNVEVLKGILLRNAENLFAL
jgi:TatD DNase family protein